MSLALFGQEDAAVCTNRRENEDPDRKACRCSARGEFTRFVGGQAQTDAHTGPAATHSLRRSWLFRPADTGGRKRLAH
ncbi:hypothetical protein CKO43_05205 [Rubrivivax gelatinosus]|uniref:Uncharacterized protein n=1 Tax=Rubrivivax gelatinosus TaxID=28068 RepID=A0ABS1DS08_RUBGE|nr:hypothetical protein [Rubrivivax gelatinosus]